MYEKEMCLLLTLAQGSELPVHVTWAVFGARVPLPLITQQKQGHQTALPAAAGCWLGYAE